MLNEARALRLRQIQNNRTKEEVETMGQEVRSGTAEAARWNDADGAVDSMERLWNIGRCKMASTSLRLPSSVAAPTPPCSE